jgi:hypothetical protein
LLEQSGVEQARRLARAIWLLSEGAISLILIHGDRGYSAAASDAARALVHLYGDEYGAGSSPRRLAPLR